MTLKKSKAKSGATPPPSKENVLRVVRVEGKSDERMYADLVTDGLATNASNAIRYIQADQGHVSLTDLVGSLADQGRAINKGDLGSSERMLNAQAVTLNAIFGELARRAALNMGQYPDMFERYMRLAFKAQAQSRHTVETLFNMKNPRPVAFVQQANISNGPQQVNNGVGVDRGALEQEPARAHQFQPETAKLLDDLRGGASCGEALSPAKRARVRKLVGAKQTIGGR